MTATMAPPRRYPLDHLKRTVGMTDIELASRLPCGWCSPCRQGAAHRCEHPGLTDRQLRRKRDTGLTNLEADRYAVACGTHPAAIWPGWDGDRDVRTLADTG